MCLCADRYEGPLCTDQKACDLGSHCSENTLKCEVVDGKANCVCKKGKSLSNAHFSFTQEDILSSALNRFTVYWHYIVVNYPG